MGKWFSLAYDAGMKPLEAGRFKEIRRKLLNHANGHVLEIGAGSGINFPFYENAIEVDAIEPDSYMLKKAKQKSAHAKVPIRCQAQIAEELAFPDDSFDTVVATLVFCTIPDPEKALMEIRRVSKPGATILFFEHVKMEQPFLAKIQDALTPVWKKMCDGCHLNRDTSHLIKKAGFLVEQEEKFSKGLFISLICKNPT